jgi:hypothetical protein
MTRIFQKIKTRIEPSRQQSLTDARTATLSARDPLAFAAALQILG